MMLKKMELEMNVWGDEEVRSEEVKSENRSFPHDLNRTSRLVVPFVTLMLIHITRHGSKHVRYNSDTD